MFEPYASRNIVSTVNLDCRLDLKQIALQARNAEYNPKVCLCLIIFLIQALLFLVYVIPHLLCMFIQRFAAVIMRIREPKTTALIFASGKMVSYLPLKSTFIYGCILLVTFKFMLRRFVILPMVSKNVAWNGTVWLECYVIEKSLFGWSINYT